MTSTPSLFPPPHRSAPFSFDRLLLTGFVVDRGQFSDIDRYYTLDGMAVRGKLIKERWFSAARKATVDVWRVPSIVVTQKMIA
jgi:hypothetical protein